MTTISAGIAGCALGVAIGAWCYRYLLRRNPAMIERLAAQARALGRKL